MEVALHTVSRWVEGVFHKHNRQKKLERFNTGDIDRKKHEPGLEGQGNILQ